MPPILSLDDAVDGIRSNRRIVAANRRAALPRISAAAHFQNIGFGNFCHTGGASSDVGRPVARATLGDFVSDVVLLRSGKKMSRVNAWGIVAVVAREPIPQRLSHRKFKRNTVREQRFIVDRNNAVATAIDCAAPRPAFARRSAIRIEPKLARERAILLDAPRSGKHYAAVFAGLVDPVFHNRTNDSLGVCRQGA